MNTNTSNTKKWSGIVKNFTPLTTLRLKNMSRPHVEKLKTNYIKYGIIDYDILDYSDDEIEGMFKDYSKEKENDANDPLLNENNELRKRLSDLSIENIILKRSLSLMKQKLKDQSRLNKYISYLEKYADQLLIENYREQVFYDKSLNEDNYEHLSDWSTDEEHEIDNSYSYDHN